MKNVGLSFLALLASACVAAAQVIVEVTPEQDQFLPGEAIPVSVKIINRSGQLLHLGKDAGWLTFNVESKEGFIVVKSGEAPVAEEFDLQSAELATEHVDIAPYFNVSKPGRYIVTATARIRQWGAEVASEPRSFDIVRGVKLWEREFGVPPASPESQTPPEMRKYTLLKSVSRTSMKIYLRLTDSPETQVYKVFPIGPAVSFSRLEPQLDPASNLHLIYQTGSHTLLYSVVNPQGEVVRRETYDYTETRPRLKTDAAGLITVTGGVRRLADNDIPRPNELPLTDAGKPSRH